MFIETEDGKLEPGTRTGETDEEDFWEVLA